MIPYIYVSGAIAYAIFLAIYFMKDKDTSKTDVASWKIFFLACLIWPIAIPVSYYGKRKKSGGDFSSEIFE